jgi:hypothetical protein
MPSAKKQAAKKRRGPAPKGEYAEKSSVLSTRITADLREWLERATRKSGRTLSQEIENRLRQTFIEERQMIDRFGSERTARVLQVVANILQEVRDPENPSAEWLDGPRTFEVGLDAIHWALEAVGPKRPADWHDLERIREHDDPSYRWDLLRARRKGREVWQHIAGADRALPLDVRMTPKQHLASIIKNKIPEIVERSKTDASGASWQDTEDEPETADFTAEEIEATNKVRRGNYYCIYCDELYPKDQGSQCPNCKGLDLSGRKHGGDGRQIKLLSPDEPGDAFTLLAEPRHEDREEEQ